MEEDDYLMIDWAENLVKNCTMFNPIKKALFITHDGVEIFDEDIRLYPVRNDNLCHGYPCELSEGLNTFHFTWFSNKLAAQKYIDDNKPVFSRKQVNDAIEKAEQKSDCIAVIMPKFKKELGF